jgi:hypothetical protein
MWVSGAAAFKRAFPCDIEAAFQCFDVWSVCSAKYSGTGATRQKFDEVPADYGGDAIPVTVEILDLRARRRAENIVRTLYSPVARWQMPQAFSSLPLESLGEGIPRLPGAEPILPGTLKPEDGILALEYRRYCWSKKVYDEIVAACAIPRQFLRR